MTQVLPREDAHGHRIEVGDFVLVRDIPEHLLRNLPEEDQQAIVSQRGQTLKVVAFNDYGHAELDFIDADGAFHTIWIEPYCLERNPSN